MEEPEFFISPGSSDKHHNWTGGLAQHTHEVIKISLDMAKSIPCDKNVLIIAGLWHDFGKILSYQPSVESRSGWIDAPLKKKMGGHLARSYAAFLAASTTDLTLASNPFVENIAHCILSHHGLREWGSPASPQTPEAWILHLADSASARCLGGEDLTQVRK